MSGMLAGIAFWATATRIAPTIAELVVPLSVRDASRSGAVREGGAICHATQTNPPGIDRADDQHAKQQRDRAQESEFVYLGAFVRVNRNAVRIDERSFALLRMTAGTSLSFAAAKKDFGTSRIQASLCSEYGNGSKVRFPLGNAACPW